MGDPAPSYRVVFEPLGKPTTCGGDETLLACARGIGLEIAGPCGGQGICNACQIKVRQGEIANGRPGEEWQLACQIKPLSDLVVELSARSLATPERTDVPGFDVSVPVDAAVRGIAVEMAPPTIEDCRADTQRLAHALGARGAILERVPLGMLLALPEILRKQNWRGTAALYADGTLAGFLPSDARLVGLAIDLGTTNVAAYLMDLKDGRRLAGGGLENLQRAYGADVITRLTHAVRTDNGRAELARAARKTMQMLIDTLCQSAQISANDIVDVTVCGNTAMQHLLLGLPVRQLGAAPFVAASAEAMEVAARDLDLSVAPGARVWLFPGIGGYVGGDHVADLLATQSLHTGGITVVIDVGTNTEISLLHDRTIFCLSTPSGPALEGSQISSGMRAAEGAIERVREDGSGGFVVTTIGKVEPVGLCGSGVLDAVAAMLRSGAIDKRGRIAANGTAIIDWFGQRAVRLAPRVVLTQDDVRAVQLAKGAIRAGIDMLLASAELTEDRIDRVIVAGAFGTYIDIGSAIEIGLLPRLPMQRFRQVGNSAGLGARLALLSRRMRSESTALTRRCRYIELSSLAGFQPAFMRRINF
jgi:uncharacterized 2Fe-2S/4Fe-4S cluster protein (DUF4445 family)